MEGSQSTVEDLDTITKKLTITIPASAISSGFEDSLKKVAARSKVKGFRPGKAPREVVIQLHGPAIKYEVVEKLINTSLRDALSKHELPYLGSPEIDFSDSTIFVTDEVRDVQFTAKVAVPPKPEISGYESLAVEVVKKIVTDSDIDRVVNETLKSRSKTEPLADRAVAEKGDVAETEIALTIGKKKPTPAEPYSFEIGGNTLPQEVEEGTIGMTLGETKSISVNYPHNHTYKQFQGQTVVFKVKLNGLSSKILPELNDELILSFGGEAKTVSEFKEKIRERLQKEADNINNDAVRQAALDALLEKNSFSVPQAMIDEEIRGFISRSGAFKGQSVDVNKISMEPYRAGLGEIGEKRAKMLVIVDRLVDQLAVEVTDSDIDAYIESLAEERPEADRERAKQFWSNPEYKNSLKGNIARDKAVESLQAKAKVSYTKEEPLHGEASEADAS